MVVASLVSQFASSSELKRGTTTLNLGSQRDFGGDRVALGFRASHSWLVRVFKSIIMSDGVPAFIRRVLASSNSIFASSEGVHAS